VVGGALKNGSSRCCSKCVRFSIPLQEWVTEQKYRKLPASTMVCLCERFSATSGDFKRLYYNDSSGKPNGGLVLDSYCGLPDAVDGDFDVFLKVNPATIFAIKMFYNKVLCYFPTINSVKATITKHGWVAEMHLQLLLE
jgi:hypothetical protein